MRYVAAFFLAPLYVAALLVSLALVLAGLFFAFTAPLFSYANYGWLGALVTAFVEIGLVGVWMAWREGL